MIYPKSIATLIEYFQKFPSIGPKSAQRMAFYLLRMPVTEVEKFSQAMLEAKNNIKIAKFVLIFRLLHRAKFARLQAVTAQLFAWLRKQKTLSQSKRPMNTKVYITYCKV